MKSAIVTGATGFLGRWLVRELLKRNVTVTAIIRPTSTKEKTLPIDDRLQTVACDMVDYRDLPDLGIPKPGGTFFHLAWAGVSGPDRQDLGVQLANVVASKNAVECAAALGCDAFVGLGTIMEQEAIMVTDNNGSKPGLGYIYGACKHAAHLVTKAAAAQLGISHLWAILTNAYGEYEHSPRFIGTTLRKILQGETLEFSSGTQNYDFIHVEDAVKALCAIAEKGRPYHQYIIGSGHAAPLRTFIQIIGDALAPDRELCFGRVSYTGVQIPLEAFSTDALYADTGFVPSIPFEDGIRRTMEWLKTEEEMRI